MSKQSFVRDVPEGYRLAKHINAAGKRFGIIFNVISAILMFAVIYVVWAIFCNTAKSPINIYTLFGISVFAVTALLYCVLHELTHGAVYKIATGEKLKFGITGGCAFCGVSHVYVYRKYVLFAALAPLVLFTVLIVPIMAVCLALLNGPHSEAATVVYLAVSPVLGTNIGGSVGDLYVTYLLLFKFKGKETLVRDTGPEQYFYVRDLYENEKKEERSGEA